MPRRTHLARLILCAVPLCLGAGTRPAAALPAPDASVEISDLYAFVAPDDSTSVAVIATFRSFDEPAGGPLFPGFDDGVLYALHVDHDRDCVADVTYEFDFTTTPRFGFSPFYAVGQINTLDGFGPNVETKYTLTRIDGGGSTVLGTDLRVPPAHVGPATTPNYPALAAEAVNDLGGTKVFCGQRDDPMFMDAALFDLFSLRPGVPGTMEGGVDLRGGFNIMAICMRIPIADLTLGGGVPANPTDPDAILGIWATTSRAEQTTISATGTPVDSGSFVQQDRQGMPLVEMLMMGLGQLEAFRSSSPAGDSQFVARFEDQEIAGLIASELSVPVPSAPRNDQVEAYLQGLPGINQTTPLCDLLRLNVGFPPPAMEHRLGVLGGDDAGFPNGRRPADDALDVTLRLAAGARVSGFESSSQLGDGVDGNDVAPLAGFPYLGTPHSGFDHDHHPLYPGVVSVGDNPVFTPGSAFMRLAQNAPNPFTPSTRIVFELQQTADATLTFYDVTGRQVDRVQWRALPAGIHSFEPQTAGWAPGAYFYVLNAGGQQQSRRMTLIR